MDGEGDCVSENSDDTIINNTETTDCPCNEDSSPASKQDELNNSSGEEICKDNKCDECEQIPRRNRPNVNFPEKIVLCVDVAEDPDFTPFKLGEGSTYSPLYMIKRVVEIFMYSKNMMNEEHEFALVVLNTDNAVWLSDFTKQPKDVVFVLEDLIHTSQNDTYDLTTLFDVIRDNVKVPQLDSGDSETIPTFTVRVVLVYSRSYCVPEFKRGRESFNYFASSPFFTLDVLYIHEYPTENNKCEETFNVLDGLDEQGFSYVLEVVRNATKLHDNMAKLLAHPFQRPPQKLAQYKLKEIQDTQ